ncbi:hypothetical protein RAJCM14343_2431 [Rhodococcus aetherivorans]|uniref:O-acyltransferase WSD1 C-terminal domain-containing protein n=2 Tax=Rhodococcus aetherivorans TaxID=191292 RepID=A0ABQ0YKW2_9NOCA|nr:hypothetical protein RAJCM14343_2431 [Rhodococcus aetherivorans]
MYDRICAMDEARLTVLDAAYHLESSRGPHLDWTTCWVFDSGDRAVPSPEEVTTHLLGRAPLVSVLRRRLREVPGGLDYPDWVVDDTPFQRHIEHHTDDGAHGMSWAQFLEGWAAVTATPLAPGHAWRLHVFHDVRDAPTAAGAATVVVFDAAHSLIAGPSIASLSAALFGVPGTPATVPGLGAAAESWDPRVRAATAIARGPFRMARWAVGLLSADRPTPTAITDRPLTRFNRGRGARRTIRTMSVDPAVLRRGGLTVTETALTAIAEAMQRYLHECDGMSPDALAAAVTVALTTAPEELGVNRLGAVTVDLRPDLTDPVDRSRAIRHSLTEGRRACESPATSTALRIDNLLPRPLYPVVAAQRRRGLDALRAAGRTTEHAVLTSVNCGNAQWSLCGRDLVQCAMTVPLPSHTHLTHGLVGTSAGLTLSVHGTPESLPDPDRYLALLTDAFSRVGTALTAQLAHRNEFHGGAAFP